jgi:hypothetical protein
MSERAETVVVSGALAQTAGLGGLTWVFLQYILGFRRLGYDVLVLDRLDDAMCVDASGSPCAVEQSANLAYFTDVMQRFDLAGRFSLFVDGGRRTVGLSRAEVVRRTESCALFVNVSGYFDDEEVRDAARPRLAYLDIDPGFAQMWHDLGLAEPFRGHDLFVTIGENVGADDCEIPTCGLDWITTPQPVVLHEWPVTRVPDGPVTTVATWRGPMAPVEWEGKTFGLRVHEFRKFAAIPRLTSAPFEVALSIHPDDRRDLELLRANGWTLVDPVDVVADPWAYRQYVQRSRAELMVAKGMYVDARSGWFSDRSICYLASGKPVLAQDTGLGAHYASGEGVILFSTLDEALDGLEEILGNYGRHSAAAREVAEAHFASDAVLSRLLDEVHAVTR